MRAKIVRNMVAVAVLVTALGGSAALGGGAIAGGSSHAAVTAGANTKVCTTCWGGAAEYDS